jgi:hypothetical protein
MSARHFGSSVLLLRKAERFGGFETGKKSLLSGFKKLYWLQVCTALRNGMGGLGEQNQERWGSVGGNPALFLLCTLGRVTARIGFGTMESVANRPYTPFGAMRFQGNAQGDAPMSGIVERKGGSWRWRKVV